MVLTSLNPLGNLLMITVMAGVSASGELMPFQCMWQGYSAVSLPKPSAPGYAEAVALGFRFEFTCTSTYWSTEETMKSYVKYTLVPYFEKQKSKMGKAPTQPCIWQLDCWSVHIAISFRTWMAETYPWIILELCPGRLHRSLSALRCGDATDYQAGDYKGTKPRPH